MAERHPPRPQGDAMKEGTSSRGDGDVASDASPSYAELQLEKERFRELSDAAFEGIAIHDSGILVDCNQALLTMFGYERSEMIGRHVLTLAAPESRELVTQKFTSGSLEPYEALGMRKDATKFACQLRGKPIHYQG